MRYILLSCLIVIIVLVLISITILLIIKSYEKRYILNRNSLVGVYDTVIILGAGIRKDGTPCDLLADRIEIGVQEYLNDNCKSILLTGEDKNRPTQFVGLSNKEKIAAIAAAFECYLPMLLIVLGSFGLVMLLIMLWLS